MDSPPWPAKSSRDRKMATQKLIRGRQFASELRNHLQNPQINCGSNSIQRLAGKVLKSIEEALRVVNPGEAQDGCQIPVSSPVCSSSSDDDTGKYSNKNVKTPVTKHHRGGYKRRRTAESWTKISANPFDDGHAWRKYGQKEILGAKHRRSYFRCTHKHDQGCEATKQVQQREDDSSMHLITYIGCHTCRDSLKRGKVAFDSPPREPVVLNFPTPFPGRQDQPSFPSFPTIKQVGFEEKPRDPLTQSPISTSDFLMLADHPQPEFKSYSHMKFSTSATPSESGDVASGVYSATSSEALDMDTMVDSVQLDDIFNFDHGDLFNNML